MNAHLEAILRHMKRLRQVVPAAARGLDLIKDEAIALADELEAVLARIAAANNPPAEPPNPGPDPPSGPPIVVDRPPPPVVGGNAPDFSEFAFASGMPAWRGYVKPTETDCDWVLDRPNLRAVSRRGLATVTLDPTKAGWSGTLLRDSRAAGHQGRLTVGIIGYGGTANVGGFHGGQGPEDVTNSRPEGWEPLDVQFVGLSDDAAIQVRWGGATHDLDWGKTARLACFDIGIVGSPSNHGIVQNKPCGEIIFDGFWPIYPEGHPDGSWSSWMHLANYDWLVLRGLKRRGRRPNDPGAMVREHQFYLKGSSKPGSATYVLGCDLRGGNRSGVQYRPGTDDPYSINPTDTLIITDNVCDSHGYDHVNEDGGAAFSIQAGVKTFVVRNRARNSRYMSLMVGAQPLFNGIDRNWYDDEQFALGEVYVDGNDFGNVGSPRHCVSISNARRVFFGDKNRVDGKLAFDSEMSKRTPARGHGRVMLVGDFAKFPTPYTALAGSDIRMGAVEMAALHVPTQREALGQ